MCYTTKIQRNIHDWTLWIKLHNIRSINVFATENQNQNRFSSFHYKHKTFHFVERCQVLYAVLYGKFSIEIGILDGKNLKIFPTNI